MARGIRSKGKGKQVSRTTGEIKLPEFIRKYNKAASGETFTHAELGAVLGITPQRAGQMIRDGDVDEPGGRRKWCKYVGKRTVVNHKGTICHPMEYRVIKGAK